MKRLPKLTVLLCLLGVLISGCKKDSPIIPPANNDIIETAPPYQKPYSVFINNYIGGYYEALPSHYAVTTKKYPLLVFIHGGGQLGDGMQELPLVLLDGVAKEINEQKFPANFVVDGKNFSFIVLSPQFRAVPPDSMVKSFIDYALSHYRVDSSRIYLSGLSMGGVVTTEMAGIYTSLFAAVAPIAGESFGTERELFARNIARGGLALWAFHNTDDPTITSNAATNFIDLINSNNPVIVPKLTLFPVYGHDAWTQALNPAYKENNMNVYEWMLHHKR